MTLEGIPPIPADIAEAADRYARFRAALFTAWHPDRLEMLTLMHFAEARQVYRLTEPIGFRERLTYFDEPTSDVGVYDTDESGNASLTFGRDIGGNESFQIYRFNLATGRSTPLTDGKKRDIAFSFYTTIIFAR